MLLAPAGRHEHANRPKVALPWLEALTNTWRTTRSITPSYPVPTKGLSVNAMWTTFRDRFVYGRLAFAEPAESIRLARQALRVEPGHTVAGITSSGDILLSLLADGPASVRGFDSNPTQTALARLKLILRHHASLDHSLGFLGLTGLSPRGRMAFWVSLKRHLGTHADYLDVRNVEAGLLNSGVATRLAGAALAALRYLAGRDDYARLVALDTAASVRMEILDRVRRGKRYRYAVKPPLRSARVLFQHFFFPPALCTNSDYPRRALKDLLCYFERVFEIGFSDNPVFCRHLTGAIPDEQVEHLYSPAAWTTVQGSECSVTFETLSLESGLAALGKGSTDAFYLSNAPDYMRPEGLQRLAEALIHAARPGARVYYLSLEPGCPFDRCHVVMPFHHAVADERELRQADPVGLYPYLGVLVRE